MHFFHPFWSAAKGKSCITLHTFFSLQNICRFIARFPFRQFMPHRKRKKAKPNNRQTDRQTDRLVVNSELLFSDDSTLFFHHFPSSTFLGQGGHDSEPSKTRPNPSRTRRGRRRRSSCSWTTSSSSWVSMSSSPTWNEQVHHPLSPTPGKKGRICRKKTF